MPRNAHHLRTGLKKLRRDALPQPAVGAGDQDHTIGQVRHDSPIIKVPMAEPLPRLRNNLDFMPSPVPERPGLLIRDPYHYSDATLIIPPVLVECLECFDGKQTELELRSVLFQLTGELNVGDLENHLIDTLKQAGFLEDENYMRMRGEREREFAAAPIREPAHVGSAYPEDPEAWRETLDRYMNGAAQRNGNLIGIAAPHVSPEGGWRSYQAAYAGVGEAYKDRTFVILGTSHYGHPDQFGLTRKAFVTPWGSATTDTALVDGLGRRAPEAG